MAQTQQEQKHHDPNGKPQQQQQQMYQDPNGQYPPGYYPNPYYTQGAPPAQYDYNQAYGAPAAAPEQRRRGDPCSSFFGRLILFLIFLIVFYLIFNLVFFLSFRPNLPTFWVDSLAVSNFSTEKNPLLARWDAKVTLRNTNKYYKADLDRFDSTMIFKDSDELGSSPLQPIHIEPKESKSVQLAIGSNAPGQVVVPTNVEQEMDQERKKGSVTFKLRFKVWVTWDSSWWLMSRRQRQLKVNCNDLKVNFGGGSMDGTLDSGKRDDCKVEEDTTWNFFWDS